MDNYSSAISVKVITYTECFPASLLLFPAHSLFQRIIILPKTQAIIFTQRLTKNSKSMHEDKFPVILLCCCLSCVQLFCDPMDCSPPGSSVHGIIPARILEWVAISSSRRSSWPRDRTLNACVSCIGRLVLYHWGSWEALCYTISPC